MMSIGQFSERTGLSPKTLRYYEEVHLLIPVIRLDNGYRQYAYVQIEKAQLISGLRQAGVSIAGIRDFVDGDQVRKQALLVRWREEAATRLLSVQVANQFLNGLDSGTTHVHLTHWDEPRTIIWFETHVGKSAHHWAMSAQEHQRLLMKLGVQVERSTYVRFDSDEETTHGEMGFVMHNRDAPVGQRVEVYPPTLFATLQCHANMPLPCKPIFATIRQFGFRPVGTPLRRYPDSSAFVDGRYLLMVPVVQSGRGG